MRNVLLATAMLVATVPAMAHGPGGHFGGGGFHGGGFHEFHGGGHFGGHGFGVPFIGGPVIVDPSPPAYEDDYVPPVIDEPEPAPVPPVVINPQPTEPATTDMPFLVGPADRNTPVCSGGGNVTASSFAALRTGPSVDFRMVDKLYPGQAVTICDESGLPGDPVGWFAVVYIPGDTGGADVYGRCLAPYQNNVRQIYRGPCRYGWVNKALIGNLNG